MKNMKNVNYSKLLSYVLRHNPSEHKIVLDSYGWAETKDILCLIEKDLDYLVELVETNNKSRFRFNDDKSKIKANQGHSIDILNDMEIVKPKFPLYHGTKVEYLNNIYTEGLKPMSRQYVHLSVDKETAKNVASRRKGESIILEIDTKAMNSDSVIIYLSENGVYLTEHVIPNYLK